MKIRVQVPLKYGILFLQDPYGDPEIPEDTGAAPITFTESCVCFQVAAYIDGDTDVTLSDEAYAGHALPSFAGKIHTPGKHISLTDVPGSHYCILALKSSSADIIIWNHDENGVEASWIQISELDLFK